MPLANTTFCFIGFRVIKIVKYSNWQNKCVGLLAHARVRATSRRALNVIYKLFPHLTLHVSVDAELFLLNDLLVGV